MTTQVQRASRDRALFDRIAARYARKDLYGPSGAARRARLLRTVGAAVSTPSPDVLEVGCGAGYAARHLHGWFGSYTGIDYSRELIEFAEANHEIANVAFTHADLYDLAPEPAYDVVFAIGALHHMPDIPRALAIMRASLRPGGVVVVNEPHPGNVLVHLLRKVRARLDPSYSDEQEELPASTLTSLFRDAGLGDVHVRAQGLFSTPFAEVVLRPECFAAPACRLACAADARLEDAFPVALRHLSWNLIVSGRA